MVAWNESKQKEVVTIDLKHACGVVDLNPDLANMSPASKMTRMTSWDMDDEGYGVARPNSFRVDFDDGEAITFSADSKSEKARWYVDLHSGAPVNWCGPAVQTVHSRSYR